jgi:26S proteasome regulatory subunit N9
MEIDKDVPAFLAAQRDSGSDEEISLLYQMEDLYERRLWHQLTTVLLHYLGSEGSLGKRVAFVKELVYTFAVKINQLKLVELVILATRDQTVDNESSLSLLEDVDKRVLEQGSQEAHVYATIEIASLLLQMANVERAQKLLGEASVILDTFDSVERGIHAAYYRVSSDCNKAMLEYTGYYRNTLLYLACIDLESLSLQQRRERAYALGIAALLGERIYNFGELLLHPILNDLEGTDYDWLRKLLFTMNVGNIDEFQLLVDSIYTDVRRDFVLLMTEITRGEYDHFERKDTPCSTSREYIQESAP